MSNWRRMLWSICSNTFLPQSSPPSSAHSSSHRHHRRRNLMDFCYIILFLHFFQGKGVGGATFTFLNNCSQDIWPAVSGEPRVPGTTGFELRRGISVDLQVSTSPWKGRMWGRTGCTFNANGNGSCDTGDCSGRLDCTTSSTSPTTLAEFYLGGSPSMDLYDVSVINGYNLPLLVQSLNLNESAQCSSTGCVGAGDLNKVCPNESRTSRNGACDATRVANYSQVIKKVCPNVIIHPTDNTMFSCPRGGDYVIIFCPGSSALTERVSIHRPPTNSTPQTGNGTSPAQSPGNSPNIFTDYPRTRNGKSPAKLIIIVVALGIVCVLIVSIILLCFLKRRRSKSAAIKESQQQMEKFLLQHGSVAPKRYKFSEIKKITKSFNDKLGQGGYGSVYKGMLLDGSVVAVKVLVETDDSSNGEEFMNEVASISKTSHVNIVTLLGFCYDGNKRALVYEFMPNKSLDKFLKNDGSDNNAGCSLDLEKLYKIAVGIAKGLEYLHTGCNTRIVHFDIKPQNILLDEDFCPKISDFGLAKLCKKKQSVLSVLGTRGTIGYIAPEVFSRNFGAVSHKSDVYSYGMMVLEMAGAENISDTSAVQSSENYFPDKIYEHVMHFVTRRVNDLMIEEGEETAIQMYLVGFWCIQTNPRDRPSISRVVEMLEGSVESIEIPPKPVLFAPTTPEQNIPSSLSANVDTQSSVEGR